MRIKNKIKYQNIEKLLKFTRQTWSKWKKENRPIVYFLENYFSDSDIEEFLETQKIKKFDNLMVIEQEVIKFQAKKYINTFLQKTQSNTLRYASSDFIDFYFSFLVLFDNFLESEKLDSLSVNKKSFHTMINSFFVDYIFEDTKLKDIKKTKFKSKTINSYMYLFSDWDNLMSIFLSQSLKNGLSGLFDYEDMAFNNLIREEVYLHTIGLYVYQNHSTLSSKLKVNLTKNLLEKTTSDFLIFDELIKFIKKIENEAIDKLIELGFDKHY